MKTIVIKDSKPRTATAAADLRRSPRREQASVVYDRLLPQEQTLIGGLPAEWVLECVAHPDRYGVPVGERDTECGMLVMDAAASIPMWKAEDEAQELIGFALDERLEDRPDRYEHEVNLAGAAGVVR